MIVWPDQAVRDVAAICREYGVFLIFDEVMTGFGRTGAMFAADRVGVNPDFMCLSKGLTGGTLPLSVTLTTRAVYESFLSNEKASMFFHGHSFTGNALACAAAVAALKLFDQDGTLNRIEGITQVHRERLTALDERVKNPRLCGTIAAFDLNLPESSYTAAFSDQIRELALAKDLFIRPLGSTLYLLPCYVSTAADLHRAWDVLEEIAGDLS
jgi:adenosylmethionine---8-amino-7-oxononanoate aminotransferase